MQFKIIVVGTETVALIAHHLLPKMVFVHMLIKTYLRWVSFRANGNRALESQYWVRVRTLQGVLLWTCFCSISRIGRLLTFSTNPSSSIGINQSSRCAIGMRLSVTMCPFVPMHVAIGGKGLPAKVTTKWPFSRVHQHVAIE